MLNIFKNFSCKTSILDDFDFYENRQKVMQDRRGKPLTTSLGHFMVYSELLFLYIYFIKDTAHIVIKDTVC